MKVTANQQVIARPELVKANKPGFHNLGKDAKVNTLGQLVSRSEGSKKIKRAFGFENELRDTGPQKVGEKEEKESKFVIKDVVGQKRGEGFQGVGQKGRAIDAFV
ncbi:MAG: hypothetical protein ACE5GU_11615 [Candidatus Scalinduaceae bacterium]